MENLVGYKKAKKCNSINRKTKRNHFKKVANGDIMSNKAFCKKVKPFLTRKELYQH